MKKWIFLLAGVASLSNVNAQPATKTKTLYGIDTKKVRFGAYLAPTVSWMRSTSKTDDNKNYNIASNGSKVGFTYGLMAEYQFHDNYALITGLQMNMGGGKMSMDRVAKDTQANMIQNAKFTYNINYLEIPVAIKLRTDPIANFRFFGQAGINLGINVGKKAAYDLNYFDANKKYQTVSKPKDKLTTKGAISASVAPILVSMSLGIGAEYPLTDKLAGYFGIFFNNGFAPDATYPQNFELYDASNNKITVNNTFKDGNVRFNNFAFRFGLFF